MYRWPDVISSPMTLLVYTKYIVPRIKMIVKIKLTFEGNVRNECEVLTCFYRLSSHIGDLTQILAEGRKGSWVKSQATNA